MSEPSEKPLRIGVSSCLLGQKVRFDGGHKEDAFVHRTLADFVEFIPVCPEVEIGLGIPRETIRLEGDPANPRLVAPKSGRDLTEKMRDFALRKMYDLEQLNLDGYILKKDSPSCVMERVRVYQPAGGGPGRTGVGLFAAVLIDRFPSLPVEAEGRLNDPVLRENFVERVFAYRRLRQFLSSDPSPGALVEFHASSKLALMAHSPKHYRELGRLVAAAGKQVSTTVRGYAPLFMEALKVKATRRKHANVLYHLMGYLKQKLAPDDKAELVTTVEEYRMGRLPLIVPITLLKHHFRRHPADWVARQTYLTPYPAELMLRNHV